MTIGLGDNRMMARSTPMQDAADHGHRGQGQGEPEPLQEPGREEVMVYDVPLEAFLA